MKISKKKSEELDIDFIQSKPLTEQEKKDLSAFIKMLKSKKKGKERPLSPKKTKTTRLTA